MSNCPRKLYRSWEWGKHEHNKLFSVSLLVMLICPVVHAASVTQILVLWGVGTCTFMKSSVVPGQCYATILVDTLTMIFCRWNKCQTNECHIFYDIQPAGNCCHEMYPLVQYALIVPVVHSGNKQPWSSMNCYRYSPHMPLWRKPPNCWRYWW